MQQKGRLLMLKMSNALAAATRALELASQVRTPLQSLDNQTHALSAEQLIGAIDTPREGLKRAKKTLTTLATKTVQESGYFYRKGNKGQAIGMPCCPYCLTEEAQLVRLTESCFLPQLQP
jgi:hypothetical protein